MHDAERMGWDINTSDRAAVCRVSLPAACIQQHAFIQLLARFASSFRSYGADAGATDDLGNTPAHLAVQGGHLDLLVTLLQASMTITEWERQVPSEEGSGMLVCPCSILGKPKVARH